MIELQVGECISAAWKIFKSRPWFFISSSAIVFAAGIVTSIPRTLTHGLQGSEAVALGVAAFFISMGLSFLVNMGKTALYLHAHDSAEDAELSELWHPHPYWKFIGTALLSALAVLVGLILFILPGIIVGILICFASYIVIEKRVSPFEALRQSATLTKGNRGTLFLLGLALLGINILGFIAVIVGLLVTIPLSTLATVHAYRILSKNSLR